MTCCTQLLAMNFQASLRNHIHAANLTCPISASSWMYIVPGVMRRMQRKRLRSTAMRSIVTHSRQVALAGRILLRIPLV